MHKSRRLREEEEHERKNARGGGENEEIGRTMNVPIGKTKCANYQKHGGDNEFVTMAYNHAMQQTRDI